VRCGERAARGTQRRRGTNPGNQEPKRTQESGKKEEVSVSAGEGECGGVGSGAGKSRQQARTGVVRQEGGCRQRCELAE